MWWSDFSRKARNVFDRHVKKIIIAAVIAVSLFFILESKRLSGMPSAVQDSWTIGILLDLGTGALVSVLIFIAFDQIYQNVGRLNRLSRQPDFDYMHLLNHEFPKFKSANHRQRRITIMDNWLPLLRDYPDEGQTVKPREEFEKVLAEINQTLASRSKSLKIEILILHPESDAAKIRHQQRTSLEKNNKRVNPLKEIRYNATYLRLMSKKYENIDWDIRLSKVPLMMDLYVLDSMIVQSFYPPRDSAASHGHLLIPKFDNHLGELAQYVQDYFDVVFRDTYQATSNPEATIVRLDDYWRLNGVTIKYFSPENEELEIGPLGVKYVFLNKRYYLMMYEYHRDYKAPPHAKDRPNRNRAALGVVGQDQISRIFLGKGRFEVTILGISNKFVYEPPREENLESNRAGEPDDYRASIIWGAGNDNHDAELCRKLETLSSSKYHDWDPDIGALSKTPERPWIEYIIELDFEMVHHNVYLEALKINSDLRYVKPPLTEPLYLNEPIEQLEFGQKTESLQSGSQEIK